MKLALKVGTNHKSHVTAQKVPPNLAKRAIQDGKYADNDYS